MSRYKCVVAYDGINYIGWQTQPHGPTIQESIEKTIFKISKLHTNVIGSGRTDGKVHAKGQCFHFDSQFSLDAIMWKKALNGHLPKDIRILTCEEVSNKFHARFSAKEKHYDYLINIGDYDVFQKDYAYQCFYKLDLEKMIEVSKLFVGKHDFTAFCANSLEANPNQVRTIDSIDFSVVNNVVTISFKGKGFLRYMVRMLVGTMIEVARGRVSVDEVIKIMKEKDKTSCKFNAKPYGLYLMDVKY